jgi:hypothetical protein
VKTTATVYRLKSGAGQWLAFDQGEAALVDDIEAAETWPRREAADLLRETMLREQGWRLSVDPEEDGA